MDLSDRGEDFEFVRSSRPDVVLVAAARVGGIVANSTYPAEFLGDNLLIQTNLLAGGTHQRHAVLDGRRDP